MVHHAGVAGGSVTAFLLYALENGIIDGAIVAGYDENEPWKVKAKIATKKEDLLNCVRSKYAICNILTALRDAVDQGLEKIAIVALPCHTYALRKMRRGKIVIITINTEEFQTPIPVHNPSHHRLRDKGIFQI